MIVADFYHVLFHLRLAPLGNDAQTIEKADIILGGKFRDCATG